MADVTCIGITGSCKEVSQFHPTNSIRQNKCVWLTASVWEQFKDLGTKRIKRNKLIHWVKRSYFKITIVIRPYLKWATGKEWIEDLVYSQKAYSVKVVGEPIILKSSSNKCLWACLKLKNYIQAFSMY